MEKATEGEKVEKATEADDAPPDVSIFARACWP